MADISPLVRAAQAGDLDSFETIVVRLQDLAVSFAYSILGDFHLAEDVAQEAFMSAFANLHQLREPKAYLGWFRRILVKHCDRLTRVRKREAIPLEMAPDLPDSRPDTLESLANQEMRTAVIEAINTLSDKQRQAVMLFYMSGYSQKEIAAFLGTQPTTINSRLQSARERLKQLLRSEERMSQMVKETLSSQAPSRDDTFVNAVGICAAAASGDAERVRLILDREPELANINYPDPVGDQKPILLAAREGHAEIVQLLLEADVDPLGDFHHNHYYPCALSTAREHAHTEVVDLIEQHLIAQLDADPDKVFETDQHGNTWLFRLVYHSCWSLIPELIDRGAEVNCRNHMGERPIHRSLYKWHLSLYPLYGDSDRFTAGVLLSRGAEYDIWVASALGETCDVSRMLQQDANLVNFHNGATHMPAGTSFPLTIAAREGHVDVARLLLEREADPDARNVTDDFEEWGAPLVLATRNGHTDVAHLLLDYGANPNTMIDSAPSAVDYAFEGGDQALIDRMVVEGGRLGIWTSIRTHNYALISELLDRASEDGAGESFDNSILANAVWQGEPQVVRMCLKREPDISPSHGMRLLHNALNSHNREGSWEDYAAVIRQLLAYGVDPNSPHPDRPGAPLHWLADEYFQNRPDETEMIGFARIFLEHGADIDARDSDTNSTPLAWAARYGHRKYVEYLLAQGAQPHLPDNPPGTTPLDWAEAQGFTDIAIMLKSAVLR